MSAGAKGNKCKQYEALEGRVSISLPCGIPVLRWSSDPSQHRYRILRNSIGSLVRSHPVCIDVLQSCNFKTNKNLEHDTLHFIVAAQKSPLEEKRIFIHSNHFSFPFLGICSFLEHLKIDTRRKWKTVKVLLREREGLIGETGRRKFGACERLQRCATCGVSPNIKL